MYSIQRSQVFPTCSYPQEQPKKATKCARNVVKLDIGNVIVGLKPGVNSARLKRMQHKPAEGIQISLGITPLHPVEGRHWYRNRKELNHFGQVYQRHNNSSMRSIEDNCSPTHQLNISKPQKYHPWQLDKGGYEEAARTLEEIPISDNLCENTLRYNSTDNNHLLQ